MSTTEPIRSKLEVNHLSNYYLKRGELRNYLLILLCVHTALRISDILRLTWDDVYDFKHKCFHKYIEIVEQKTKKRKRIAFNKQILSALKLCRKLAKQDTALIESRKGGSISRIQAYRIIRSAGESIGMTERISCHSLRKTFGYHAWKNGVSPVILMEIYNHSSYHITRKYLGVSQDDKDEVYKNLSYA